SFLRYGSATVPGIASGAAITGIQPSMSAVPSTATLSGDYFLAPGDVLTTVHAGTTFGAGNTILDGESITYPGYTATSGSFSLATPQIPGAHAAALFEVQNPSQPGVLYFGRTGLVGNESNVKVTLPPVPLVLTPPAGSTLTHETLFAWTGPQQAVSMLVVVDDSGPGPSLAIVQAGEATTVPAIPEAGFDFIPGDAYAGIAFMVGPHATVDDAAGTGGLLAPAGTDAFVGIGEAFIVVAPPQP
ncbi:MAG TPA: hypothetical protein VMV18_13745, partial [bacterium]|nr:hypothetical protein [bacterium]